MGEDLKHDKITCVNSGTAVHSYIQTFMLWFSTSSVDHTMTGALIQMEGSEWSYKCICMSMVYSSYKRLCTVF